MIGMPRVLLAIPVFNEAKSIDRVLSAVKPYVQDILMVDDGSTDATVSSIQPSPEVRLVLFQKNAGQSAAMLAGMRVARGAVVVLLDGDLQNDPSTELVIS